jgi:DNA-binding response OmpR family regulator
MRGGRVLLVEDDAEMAGLIRSTLEKQGFEVHLAADGPSALERIPSLRPDVVILDVVLPGMDGLTVCREVRRQSNLPILMLSCLEGEVDRVVGLEVGADDYLVKPFSPRELVARVRACFRRLSWPGGEAGEVIACRDLRIDLQAHRVELLGRPVQLTPTEFRLLCHLARHPGQVLSRQDLLRQVWGSDFYGDNSAVDVHVRHLRQKLLAVDREWNYVVSVRGVGYKLEV